MEASQKIRRTRIIEALLIEPDISKVAERAGVHEKTVRRCLNDPEFLAELHRHEDDLVMALKRRALVAQEQSISALEDLRDHSESESVRLRAAQALLSLMTSYIGVIDLDQRVAELEKAVLGGY
jgi:AraC-like DNA-binding protein